MNLIISGDDPQNLAKVETLAKNLGLAVSRELGGSLSATGKSLRRIRDSRSPDQNGGRIDISKDTPPATGGPLYGIE